MFTDPAGGGGGGSPGSTPPISRRTFLAGLTTGGGASLAGCSGNGVELADRIDVDGVVWKTTFTGRPSELEFGSPSGVLGEFAYDVGFYRDLDTGEPQFVLAESVEETANRVTITLADGITWSTGDPITGQDLGRWLYMLRTNSRDLEPVPAIRNGTTPRSSREAITDVEWDEQSVTVHGAFEHVSTPLHLMNTYLGSRPRMHYADLWDEFHDAYDEEPWESDGSLRRSRDVFEGSLWDPTSRASEPEFKLEAEYDGTGWQAAFSGLWYPYRLDSGLLYFTVNETHPFAERVNYDAVVWEFRDDPNATQQAIQAETIDGAMHADVAASTLDGLSEEYTVLTGPPRSVTVLVFNHTVSYLQDRDVRAALQHAIDREGVAENDRRPMLQAVDVPGADAQFPGWITPEFEQQLRPYDYDPEQASALLEEAGFVRDGDDWLTPDGEPFEIELFSPADNRTTEGSVASALDQFGIDTTVRGIEDATYRSRLERGYFVATTASRSLPGAAGRRRTRTANIVRTPPHRPIASNSTYVGSLLYRRDGTDGLSVDQERLTFDSVDDLRTVTVEAPPLGDPDGDLEAWPYLYHATMVEAAKDPETQAEHARICTWIYNYQLPQLELVIDRPPIVHRSDAWSIPDPDDPVWRTAGAGLHPQGLWAGLAWGKIRHAENH